MNFLPSRFISFHPRFWSYVFSIESHIYVSAHKFNWTQLRWRMLVGIYILGAVLSARGWQKIIFASLCLRLSLHILPSMLLEKSIYHLSLREGYIDVTEYLDAHVPLSQCTRRCTNMRTTSPSARLLSRLSLSFPSQIMLNVIPCELELECIHACLGFLQTAVNVFIISFQYARHLSSSTICMHVQASFHFAIEWKFRKEFLWKLTSVWAWGEGGLRQWTKLTRWDKNCLRMRKSPLQAVSKLSRDMPNHNQINLFLHAV